MIAPRSRAERGTASELAAAVVGVETREWRGAPVDEPVLRWLGRSCPREHPLHKSAQRSARQPRAAAHSGPVSSGGAHASRRRLRRLGWRHRGGVRRGAFLPFPRDRHRQAGAWAMAALRPAGLAGEVAAILEALADSAPTDGGVERETRCASRATCRTRRHPRTRRSRIGDCSASRARDLACLTQRWRRPAFGLGRACLRRRRQARNVRKPITRRSAC